MPCPGLPMKSQGDYVELLAIFIVAKIEPPFIQTVYLLVPPASP